MGKRIITQARGKGSPTYKSPSFRFVGKPSHPREDALGTVEHLVHCPGHTAPLAHIVYQNDIHGLMIAPEGITVGDTVTIASETDIKTGNVMPLQNIPEGTLIHNIESKPGDGGKFVRSSGVFAKVVSKKESIVTVLLPSKKTKQFNENCRASIGVIAGGGRTDKPFLKAGTKMHKMRSRNKLYPRTSAASMNAVDHPYGNKHSSRKSKARPTSRNAPRGRKVGMVAARRTGRTKK